jgi:hypothetical protein
LIVPHRRPPHPTTPSHRAAVDQHSSRPRYGATTTSSEQAGHRSKVQLPFLAVAF